MEVVFDAWEAAEVELRFVRDGQTDGPRLRSGQAREGAVTWFYGRRDGETDLLTVGLGAAEEPSLETLRRAAGAAARALLREERRSARLIGGVPGSAGPEARLQAAAEGWRMGQYWYDASRGRTKRPGTVRLSLRLEDWPGLDEAAAMRALMAAEIRERAVRQARDYVNEPPERLNPVSFVQRIKEQFADLPVQVTVYRGEELVRRGMNGLLAVGAGSPHPPALVEIAYEGNSGSPLLALVGKGVTFDMGGMNVKTGRDISDARMDMGGAAAVAGAMEILARNRAAVRVTALIAIADNLPGAAAMLPSSVVTYPNGLTVQVANTDGEGRLMLADALLHAATLGAEEAIDIATLTGNVGQALGLGLAGIWGDAGITRQLAAIGEENGERLWPMPLVDDYESELKSDYADLRNVGTSVYAGAITAALFIRKFVSPSMRWVHIDMAGTVQYKRELPYAEAGATGYGVRLLADYAAARAKEGQVSPGEERPVR